MHLTPTKLPWNACHSAQRQASEPLARRYKERPMGLGKGILLWILGVPIPIILLLAMCSHH